MNSFVNYKKYYGYEKVHLFDELFVSHIDISLLLIRELKEKNVESSEKAREEWYRCVNLMADFFSDNNPYWKKKRMEKYVISPYEINRKRSLFEI